MSFFGDIAGALGGGLVEKIFGGSSTKKAIKQQAAAQRENMAWQFENIYGKELQTRVKDAAAAGLHPLFAIGGGANVNSPAFSLLNDDIGGRMGQNVGQAISRAFDKQSTELHQANLRRLAAEEKKDLAQAAFFTSQASNMSPNNGVYRVNDQGNLDVAPGFQAIPGQEPGILNDMVQVTPIKQLTRSSSDEETAPGQHISWKRHVLNGQTTYLHQSEEGINEALESLWNPINLAQVIRKNKTMNPKWSFWQFVGALSSEQRRNIRKNWNLIKRRLKSNQTMQRQDYGK